MASLRISSIEISKRNALCQSKTSCFGVKGGILSNAYIVFNDTKTSCFGIVEGSFALEIPIYQITSVHENLLTFLEVTL